MPRFTTQVFRSSGVWVLTTVLLCAGLLNFVGAAIAPRAGASTLGEASNAIASQAWTNKSAAEKAPNDATHQPAGWNDMANDAGAGRPYVSSLLEISGNGETSHVYFQDQGRDYLNTSASAGDLTAVVSPINLCRSDQSNGQGCYATPNRIGVSLGYTTGTSATDSVGLDFAGHPGIDSFSNGVTFDQDTTIEMVVQLGTLGRNLRWSWMNGNVQSWSASGLGTDNGSIVVRFKLAHTANISPIPQSGNGCSATPLLDCVFHQATEDYLSSSLLLSVDNTMDPALTGAVYWTQGATFGYLDPGSPGNASLSIQAGGPHLLSNGSANSASISAFFPESSVISLYNMTSADAANSIAITSSGETTIGTKQSTAVLAGANQDQGLQVDLTGVTFPDTSDGRQGAALTRSANKTPTFKVSSKATSVSSSAKVSGTTTKLSVPSVPKCPTSANCHAVVYDLGAKTTKKNRVVATLRTTSAGVAVKNGTFSWSQPSSKLLKNHSYLVEFKKSQKVLSISRGNVN
ncbi:MAG: hypothetical protein WCO31_00960 [Actinomycetes bacterium]